LTRWLANRTQGRRAVGGALFLTNQRLVFRANRLEHLIGGKAWDVNLINVMSVGVAEKTGNLFDGGLRNRLKVQVHNDEPALFVVNKLPEVIETVSARLGK